MAKNTFQRLEPVHYLVREHFIILSHDHCKHYLQPELLDSFVKEGWECSFFLFLGETIPDEGELSIS